MPWNSCYGDGGYSMNDQGDAYVEREIERLQGKNRSLMRSAKALIETNGEQFDRAKVAEAERDALKAQGDELEAKLHAVMDAEQTSRMEIDALKARVAELEEQIELDVDDYTEREMKAAYDIDTLKAEVSALKAKLEEANGYLDNFRERDKTLMAKLELVREWADTERSRERLYAILDSTASQPRRRGDGRN